ncbi:TIGR02206 family membrane protein [Rhodoplanes roseus]|uniref:TIGR02206 family membrane protein n=1 Tax=Rhodoplanes roseus TaxID=29409 RepID=A0A327L236_9BRAD|nr:TIGR02206 family membrane protein [Rhodoplanes roseus]RAI44314.1 TIGR02206 family membrane protein [Rhodoplanes roseus]
MPETTLGRFDVFTAYGTMHLVTVLACFAAIAAVAVAARRLGPEREPRLRLGLGVFAFLVWGAYNLAWNWGGIDMLTGLPLHICDVGGLIAPLALLTQKRWLRATLYFWAFALTTQAFIQPTLTQGPASPLFWGFWIAHSIIFGYAVYDIAVLGFRPDWSDFRRAAAFTIAYVAVVFAVNVALGSNYAYVGNPADQKLVPPFVALLGPWPARVLVMSALAGIGFLLVFLPWRFLGKPAVADPEVEPEAA